MMIRMNFRRLCNTIALGVFLALAHASVAIADAPVITGATHFAGSDELWDCSSFKIIDYWELDLTGIRFYDDAGNIQRVILQQLGTDTFTNSVTGKAYSGTFHGTRIIDFREQPGTGAVAAGITFHLTVPGAGAVLLDVGLSAFIKSNSLGILAGPHQALEGDFAAVCEALA
jgi:hypothetical protein